MVSALRAAGLIKDDDDDAAIMSSAIHQFYRKVIIAHDYHPSSRLSSAVRVTLVKASESSPEMESVGLDYDLGRVCDATVDVRILNGTHDTFVTNSEVQQTWRRSSVRSDSILPLNPKPL